MKLSKLSCNLKLNIKALFAMTLIIQIFNLTSLFAAENWSSETDAGVVVNSGNADSQSVSLKTLEKYKLTKSDELAFRGEYFQSQGQVNGSTALTSENSLAEIKYNRVFHEMFGGFVVTTWSKDNFRGFENRFEVGPGASYHFIKSDAKNFFTEQGYLYRQETGYLKGPASGATNDINFYRSYFEVNAKLNPTLSGKVWLESKLNVEETEDIEARVEPSLSVMLSGNFSLGLAYRYSFDNVPAVAGLKRVDTMYMTTLKAKF